jgi:preprotein translocase subunit SecE
MGRQQKRKDPAKKKKATEASPATVTDKQPGKNSVAPMARSNAAAKPKNISAAPFRKSVKPVKKDADSGIRKYFDMSVQFLREVRVELKKVTWPSRKQTIGSTAVVLLLVILVSLFLGIVDFGLSSLVRLVIGS